MICNSNTTFIMPNQWELGINIIVSSLITFISIFGNLMIMVVFVKFKDLRSMNNAAISILSFSDFCRGCIIMPFKLYNQLRFAGSTNNPEIEEPICTISAFLCGFTFVFSPMLLAFIAVIRYYVIIPSNYGKKTFTKKVFVAIVLSLFIIAVIFASLPMMGIGNFRYSQSHGVCFVDWCDDNRVFRTVFYIINIFFVFPILCCCYGALFVALNRHNRHLLTSTENIGAITTNPVTVTATDNKLNTRNNHVTSKPLVRISDVNMDISPNSNSCIELPKISNLVNCTTSSNGVMIPARPKACSVLSDSSGKMAEHISNRENRITRIVLIIFLAYVICWIPAAVINVLAIADITNISIGWFYVIITLVDMKSALDPLIYGVGNPAYWKAFRKLLQFRCCHSME